MTDPESDAELIARIAGPLKAPEHLDGTFDARVMSAVHAEVLTRLDAAHAARHQETNTRRLWLLRPRAIQVSPITGFALAASVAAVFFLAGNAFQIRRQSGSADAEASSGGVARRTVTDTVHIVRFVLRDPAAKSVVLVGDFNSWTKGATPLVRTHDDGTWTISVPLARGRHEYAFIVQASDGERWIADPFGSTHLDEFGTESSVVEVGTGSESSAVNTAS